MSKHFSVKLANAGSFTVNEDTADRLKSRIESNIGGAEFKHIEVASINPLIFEESTVFIGLKHIAVIAPFTDSQEKDFIGVMYE